jgi:hypothetical protein
MNGRAYIGAFRLVLAAAGAAGAACASVEDGVPAADAAGDPAAEWSWDTWHAADTASDPAVDTATDVAWDTASDPAVDTATDVAWDTASDPASDTGVEPGPCGGTPHAGYCWYLGGEEQSCQEVCSPHGGYHEATRTFAGSDGTNWDCNDVLDALDAPGDSTGTLSASGAGVGCFVMNLVDDRFRVADVPTNATDTYTLGLRACACNE